MRLKQVLGGVAEMPGGWDQIEIKGITADSREVRPGDLFAALPGSKVDGARFIPQALEKGAVAVLAGEGVEVQTDAGRAVIYAANPRQRLSEICARFYQSQPETVVAVTGTNGKTSVANFVAQIWQLLGCRAASLGTLGVVSPTGNTALRHTTPDPIQIHRILRDLAGDDVQHLAIEASSHGLDQYRVDGIRMKAAGFTNLSQDHLDYHADLETYYSSKERLFAEVLPVDGVAVIHVDSEYGARLNVACRTRGQGVIEVGYEADDNPASLALVDHAPHPGGQTLTVRHGHKTHTVKLSLVGSFQAVNVLVAAGLVMACGETAAHVFNTLPFLQGVPGRLQLVGHTANGAAVFVDYAHTPDALRTVLGALRPHTEHRLHVVFGAGGDRDKSKRPLMGAAAADLADFVTVTDDNPRHEDADKIRQDILASVSQATEIGNRAVAIEEAVRGLNAGDILVVAGKGHETGQIVGDRVLPFSDDEVIRGCLERQGGRL